MRRIGLLLLLLTLCLLDGYTHYREQQKLLAAEWGLGIVTLQRDMLTVRLSRRCK